MLTTKITQMLGVYSFTLGQYQDIVSMMARLDQANVKLNDLKVYVANELQAKLKTVPCTKKPHKKLCPICKARMHISAVNTNPKNQTGDDSRFVVFCPKCWHDEFVKEITTETIQYE